MRLTKTVKVKNALGLHIRPATAIVKLLQNCSSKVFFVYNNHTINARSIMNILMLAIKKNSKLEIIVDGNDAESAMKIIMRGFENKFDEA